MARRQCWVVQLPREGTTIRLSQRAGADLEPMLHAVTAEIGNQYDALNQDVILLAETDLEPAAVAEILEDIVIPYLKGETPRGGLSSLPDPKEPA
jgi:hypothetical protein